MRRVLKAVVEGRDPGDITTIEDEGSVEEAREAVAELRASMRGRRKRSHVRPRVRPRVKALAARRPVVFDAYGTLFDPLALAEPLERRFPGVARGWPRPGGRRSCGTRGSGR